MSHRPTADTGLPHSEALLRPAEANRELVLGGLHLGYLLKRATRRTIGFVVGPRGLAVSAPRWVSQPQIDGAVQLKADWILRKLAEQGQRLVQLDAARIDWRDGARLPYLGEDLRICTTDHHLTRTVLQEPQPQLGQPRTLHLRLPAQATPGQIRDTVQRWLQQQARALFEARIAHHAAAMGVQVTQLRLSSARTRWGSASSDGSVRLNWRLIHFPLTTLDYVVVHELAHLHEMNHGPAFWAIVRAVMPDYEARRRTLKDGVVPVFD
ncbi:SprT family zinc-dependent metalloprotease [Sphaerotilus sp.]|uniref:M48 family metallopeptidase n=1 Tax=Sphaerotilus sp. TaxID=2093942 RepID=UPI00286D8EA4|nr:SprT family zinc-dependent metalloprotease [Sphaerotilus sp.]